MAWPKGKPRKSQLPDEVLKAQEERKAAESQQAQELVDRTFKDIKDSGDPVDKKLYAAQYEDNYTTYDWEKENPVRVPSHVLDANPGMRFRWRALDAKTGRLRSGDRHHGWKVYNTTGHPDGLSYGGDLVLCYMPEERAASYNRSTAEASSRQVRDMQEQQLTAIDRAAGELKRAGIEYEVFQPGRQQSGAPAVGISVGARKFGGKTQYRGYHPEELQEIAAKAAEERRKNKVYST